MMQNLVKSVGRIDLFDLLRGYFVLVLVLDHIERWPGVFDWITGQGRLWASAAEGFFIVSGIMIGLIRGRKAIDAPMWSVTKKLWERGLQLYLWALLMSLLFTVWGMVWPGTGGFMPPGLYDIQGDPTATNLLFRTFILEHSFGWAGFLKFYAVFIALSPIAIWLLRKGLWWVLLAISTAFWVYGLDQDNWWYSWQLLFYVGTIIGFYVPEIRGWWQQRPKIDRRILGATILSVSAILLALSIFFTFGWAYVKNPNNPLMTFYQYDLTRRFLDPYFDRVSLQPLRLIVVAFWFTSLLLIFYRFETQLKRWLGWLLMTFGQNSLYVYIIHGIFVFALDLLLPNKAAFIPNVIIIICTVGLLWYITHKKFLFKYIPR